MLRTCWLGVGLLMCGLVGGCDEARYVLDGQLSAPLTVEHLFVTIGDKDMAALEAARARALDAGQLKRDDKVEVPAVISDGRGHFRAEVRLKGDLTDHIDHPTRWSLRVKVKGGGAIFGMRRFSIQRPETRAFQFEPVFLDLLRARDVLAPRYRFARVFYNGRDIGLMAVEEHFSRELAEAQSRRESVIVRFFEDYAWFNPGPDGSFRNGGPFDQFRNAPVKVFKRGRTRRSRELSALFAIAEGLLKGVQTQQLAPGAAFDAHRTGEFLAVAELMRTHHGVSWNQWRFFLDPLTLRLEPIPYDNAPPRGGATLLRWQEPLVDALLADRAIFAAYRAALDTLIGAWDDGSLPHEIQEADARYRAQLASEFPRLAPLDLTRVQERVRQLRDADLTERRERSTTAPPRPARYPVPLYADLLDAGSGASPESGLLELRAAVPEAVRIVDGYWEPRKSKGAAIEVPLALTLDPLPIGGIPRPKTVPIPDAARLRHTHRLHLVAMVAGDDGPYVVRVRRSVAPLTRHPLAATPDDVLRTITGLTFTARGITLSGAVRFDTSVFFGDDTAVTVEAGTTVQLGEGVTVLFRGPLTMPGTAERPIRFIPAATTFGGLIVDHPGPHLLEHVQVRGTTGAGHGAWRLTGGVTIHGASNVRLTDCRFDESLGEDALNLVGSQFEVRNLTIVGTRSDALDCDFSTGSIVGGVFERVGRAGGGDAIDISGGRIEVDDVRFEQIGDKALSAGEGGELLVKNVSIRGAAAGAVSKDRSRLTLTGASMSNLEVAALMAYEKKAEFGPASLDAKDLRLDAVGADVPHARCQTGSRLMLDGRAIACTPLDVDALYDTIMKKAPR